MSANGLFGPGPDLRSRISEALGNELPLPLQPPTCEEFTALTGRRAPKMLQKLLRPALQQLASREAVPLPAGKRRWPVGVRLGPPRRLPRPPHATEGTGGAASSGDALHGGHPDRRLRSGSFY